jgi:serine/threonine protein phosphatase PrpC
MLVIRDFMGMEAILCLVADGHGVEGDQVSEFIKLKYAAVLEAQLLKEFGLKLKEEAAQTSFFSDI